MAPYRGAETVVTGTRTPRPLSDALRPITVITAEDIERGGQQTLVEVLQALGGLEVVSNGGAGSASSVFIRGANSDHNIVLVDGVRLQSATLGTTAFENIPLAQIERIEILPGPASSLYGSDAIGGVIQVFTKSRRSVPAYDAAVSAGSHGTRAARAAATGSLAATDLTISAAHFATDGINATRPTVSFGRFNADRDPYRNSSISAKIDHRFDPRNEIGASAFHSDGHTHYDNGPDSDPHTSQKLSAYSAYSRNQLTDRWQSLVRVAATRDDSVNDEGGGPSVFRTDETQASWQNTIRLGPGSAIAGAEYVRQKVDSTTRFDVRERTIKSIFAGYDVDWRSNALQASARRDDNDQFGSRTTGTLAYGYRFTPALRLRTAYGTAFHAPTFNELYFPGFGNPDLRPERARSREVGLDYQLAPSQRLVATYFDNRIRDLIAFTFNPDTGAFLPQNVAEARIRGLEASYTARVAGASITARGTWQRPEAEPSGMRLQRRATRHGSVVVSRPIGAWRLGAELVASGERFDSPNESRSSRMGGYGILNVLAGYAISPVWAVDVRWNNVGNREYELAKGFNTPGSNVLVTLRWSPVP